MDGETTERLFQSRADGRSWTGFLEVLYLGFLRRGLSTARRGMDAMDALLWLN